MPTRTSQLLLVLSCLLPLAGCATPETPPAEPAGPLPTTEPAQGGAPGPGGGGYEIAAVDNAFEPRDLVVPVGATVTWTNRGESPHSVTFDLAPVDAIVRPGASFNATFDAPGVLPYRCIFHPGMSGNLTVEGNATDAVRAAPAAPATQPPPPSEEAPRGPSSANVTIVDDAFTPSSVRVPVGGSVTWTNRGGGHSVTMPSRGVDHVLRAGETFTLRFDAPGSHAYVCAFHDEMTGTVTVSDEASGANGSDAGEAFLPDEATFLLDEGHYDERPVHVAAGGRVTWTNPGGEDVRLAFRERPEVLLVPAGGSASLDFPAGEYAWRDAREEGPWRLDDHDTGLIRAGA